MPTKTILFIHGLFVTKKCWDLWVKRYESKGYKCVAVAYPGRDKPVETLKKEHPDPKLGELTMDQVIEHHVNAIKKLEEPPILIGHSFGGLVTQILLNRGFGAAGVAVDPAPPQGVFSLKWSFLKANWPLLNPLIPASKPYLMSFSEFQYAFVNGMPLEEQRRAYDEYCVPESRRAGRGALSKSGRVDFKKSHAPLLIIAGEIDHLLPASLNKSNFERYKDSMTEFKVFPGRNHFGIGQKGWEELADYALDWVVRKKA